MCRQKLNSEREKGHNNLCILTLCNINSFNITNQKLVFHKVTSVASSESEVFV